MPDPVDIAGDYIAKEEAARKAAHLAKMANRPAVSAILCEDCWEKIPENRRLMSKGCTRCISCETEFEREGKS